MLTTGSGISLLQQRTEIERSSGAMSTKYPSKKNKRAEKEKGEEEEEEEEEEEQEEDVVEEEEEYLAAPSLCDVHMKKKSSINYLLKGAQVEFERVEAEKKKLRLEELEARRRQLKKDSGAMRLAIIDNNDQKLRDLQKGREEAQRMREENNKRKKLAERETSAIFKRKQEQIAILRGNLERAQTMREFDKRNQERKEIAFKVQFVMSEKKRMEKEKMLSDHEKRQIKHQYKSMLQKKKDDIENMRKKKIMDKIEEVRLKKIKVQEEKERKNQMNQKFKKDKERMKQARLKRQAIEKRATFSYRSKESRWWESWDDENQCQYWEREAGLGSNGNNYTYENPFVPEEIDVFEEYYELWYRYNCKTEETTLWDEIEKWKLGFNQFAAERVPEVPQNVSLDQVSTDLDSPSAGITWNHPLDPGDQPMEYILIEGAVVPKETKSKPVGGMELFAKSVEWTLIADSLPLDCDYYECHTENFSGFSSMVSARQLASMPGAPQPQTSFLFRISFVSSVGVGAPGYTDVLKFNSEEVDSEEMKVEDVMGLPPIETKKFVSRRKMKKGPVEMYQFKF